jgi:hypothetical protein
MTTFFEWDGGGQASKKIEKLDTTGMRNYGRPIMRWKDTIKQRDIHSLSGILTNDPSVLAGEVISCLRPRRHCDRPLNIYIIIIKMLSSYFPFYLHVCNE